MPVELSEHPLSNHVVYEEKQRRSSTRGQYQWCPSKVSFLLVEGDSSLLLAPVGNRWALIRAVQTQGGHQAQHTNVSVMTEPEVNRTSASVMTDVQVDRCSASVMTDHEVHRTAVSVMTASPREPQHTAISVMTEETQDPPRNAVATMTKETQEPQHLEVSLMTEGGLSETETVPPAANGHETLQGAPEPLGDPALPQSQPSSPVCIRGFNVQQLKSFMWETHQPEDVPSDGHCGFHVLFQTGGCLQKVMNARLDFFEYVDSGQGARKDFADATAKKRSQTLQRIFPNGRPAFMAHAQQPQWLSSDDLPWLAQMLQAIICVCDLNDASGWATYLPIAPNSSAPRVIAMTFDNGHWRPCTLNECALPPPYRCVITWRAAQRKEALENPLHRRLHDEYVFCTWREPAPGDQGCGCHLSASSSVAEIVEVQ